MAKIKGKKNIYIYIILALVIMMLPHLLIEIAIRLINPKKTKFSKTNFEILSTIENKDLASDLIQFGKKHQINISFKYAEDLDAVTLLNADSKLYDAVWLSNSRWVYQIENARLRNSKSISINPIVMGILKSKAIELGFVDHAITNHDLVQAIKEQKLKYVMASPIKSNSGASSYLGFLNSLAGSPELLTSEMLDDPVLKEDMVALLSGVERVAGTDTFLEDMFLASNNYQAVVAAETSLILINQKLEQQKKEPLYLIYPSDGVSICDSPFIYVDNTQNKEKEFELIQKHLLSKKMQQKLENAGRRTWYGGINPTANPNVFKKAWGIDTNQYLIPLKYPSKKVIEKAMDLYISELRKPTHTVFLLDYSGSMRGVGNQQLIEAMDYILNYETARKDYIQFVAKDKITVIPFTDVVTTVWSTSNGEKTTSLLNSINNGFPGGGTDIYIAILKALEILQPESDEYSKVIILMTDGMSTVHDSVFYDHLEHVYHSSDPIPIYSIMFGQAQKDQLINIAEYSNAKVFDGRSNLLDAFKEVRNFS